MTDADRDAAEREWALANGDYLAATLRWLRLRLELAALGPAEVEPPPPPPPAVPPPPASPPADPPARRRGWRRRPSAAEVSAAAPSAPIAALPPVTRASLLGQAEEASRERAQLGDAMSPPPTLAVLAERLDLSEFERDLLVLCSAPELDPGIGELLARAAGGGAPFPTFALGFAALEDASWDAVSPERPLRYWKLIELAGGGGGALTASALRTDERIVNYLKGLNHLDGRLTPLLAPFDDQGPALGVTGSQQLIADQLGLVIDDTPHSGRPPVVNIVGGDRSSKQLVARQTTARFGLDLLRLPVALLPADADSLDLLTRLWQRECALLPVALYLDAHELEALARPDHDAPPLMRFLARGAGLVFLDSREQWDGLPASTVVVAVGKPTATEQRSAWEAQLPPAERPAAAMLAAQFNLNLAKIAGIAASAQRAAVAEPRSLGDQLWAGCLAATRPGLDRLATHIEPSASWRDLVLAPEQLALLHEIVAQVRRRARVYDEWGFRERMNRGLGVSALFAGDSGVGKTMAAEVVAAELQLGLYRIDLSAVVSKYIGETEKNLRIVFDAAEGGGAILLFDEADALFGKRSEVNDSHDRYANIEVNYLLQRMEAYRGLAILATNAKAMLDTAFLRRLRFVVDFPFPGKEARRAIWERAFPPRAPLEPDLDLDRLARLVLTGGSIHNAALNASFLAAQEESNVTMPLLLRAIRNELKKLGRPINETDFTWPAPAAVTPGVPQPTGALR
jgi:ATPase family associated with various cellular activities (AAA)